jgi:hypothetical protein
LSQRALSHFRPVTDASCRRKGVRSAEPSPVKAMSGPPGQGGAQIAEYLAARQERRRHRAKRRPNNHGCRGRAYLATNRCSFTPDRGEGAVLEQVTVSCHRLLTAALPTVYCRRGSKSGLIRQALRMLPGGPVCAAEGSDHRGAHRRGPVRAEDRRGHLRTCYRRGRGPRRCRRAGRPGGVFRAPPDSAG